MSFYIFNDRIDVHLCERLPYLVCCTGWLEQETRFDFCVMKFLDRCFMSLVKHLTSPLHLIFNVSFQDGGTGYKG